MAGKGLDITPIRWPEKYDAAWFERFFRETVGPLADARNAIAGPGIAISASPTEPPTIAGSADVQALVTASLVTVLPEAELPHTRQLAGEAGVIEIVDGGGGRPVTIALQSIPLNKLQRIPGLSVLGSTVSGDPDEFVPAAITAGSNDLILARVSDELLFSQLTSGMFPAEVVPDAALSANVALYDGDVGQFSSGTFADARIAESNVTQHQAALEIDWSQLTSVPAFGTAALLDATDFNAVAFSGAYGDLSGTPSLATVATTGDYGDLSNTPSIPGSLGDLSDVDIGTPGSGEDGYVLAWDNGAGEFVLVEQTGGGGLPDDPGEDALLIWNDDAGEAEWIAELDDIFLSDNVPLLDASNQFTAPQQVRATHPQYVLYETDGDTDEKATMVRVNGGTFFVSSASDASPYSPVSNLMFGIRSGTGWSQLSLSATDILFNGVNATDYARLSQGATFAGDLVVRKSGFSKITLGTTASNPEDAAAVDFVEGAGSFGTSGVFGWRIKLDGSTNELLVQSGNGTTVNTRLALQRDSGTFTYGGLEVANQESGSFTATLTGMSGTVTGTVQWRRTGNKVTLFAPSAITGTSNATTMTLTGLPAAIQPASAQFRPCGLFTNNGTAIFLGGAEFAASSGTVTMWLFSGGASLPVGRASFAALGAKGLSAGWSVEYDIS